jgi:sulfur relay (sulfurtransferase) DsrF/TusC family protein
MNKTILSDADLNNQNQWGGYNNINLISDNNTLYAIYASNNNNRRISIALIDENSLNVIKTWNTDSLEKKECGPIFMINDILYHIKRYNNENDSVIYSYDLKNEKSNQINIPFENKGGYDSSLTYYPHLNSLMTVNNGKTYKYNVLLGD